MEYINDFIIQVLGVTLGIAPTGVFFFALSLIQREKIKDPSAAKNFSVVEQPSFFNKESKCELFYPFIIFFVAGPIKILIIMGIAALFSNISIPHQIFTDEIIKLPFLIQIILGLFIIDVVLYIRHRFVHVFLWDYHAVHHSAREISWITASRLHPVDSIVMGLIEALIMYMIGFSTVSMAYAIVFQQYYNSFIHSNIALDYGKPLKYIFVSPNMHRWHHDAGKNGVNKNFCTIFAFIDYFLGTYYVPDNSLPKKYGAGMKALDDIENKNIIKELLYPFKRTLNKLFKSKKNTCKTVA